MDSGVDAESSRGLIASAGMARPSVAWPATSVIDDGLSVPTAQWRTSTELPAVLPHQKAIMARKAAFGSSSGSVFASFSSASSSSSRRHGHDRQGSPSHVRRGVNMQHRSDQDASTVGGGPSIGTNIHYSTYGRLGASRADAGVSRPVSAHSWGAPRRSLSPQASMSRSDTTGYQPWIPAGAPGQRSPSPSVTTVSNRKSAGSNHRHVSQHVRSPPRTARSRRNGANNIISGAASLMTVIGPFNYQIQYDVEAEAASAAPAPMSSGRRNSLKLPASQQHRRGSYASVLVQPPALPTRGHSPSSVAFGSASLVGGQPHSSFSSSRLSTAHGDATGTDGAGAGRPPSPLSAEAADLKRMILEAADMMKAGKGTKPAPVSLRGTPARRNMGGIDQQHSSDVKERDDVPRTPAHNADLAATTKLLPSSAAAARSDGAVQLSEATKSLLASLTAVSRASDSHSFRLADDEESYMSGKPSSSSLTSLLTSKLPFSPSAGGGGASVRSSNGSVGGPVAAAPSGTLTSDPASSGRRTADPAKHASAFSLRRNFSSESDYSHAASSMYRPAGGSTGMFSASAAESSLAASTKPIDSGSAASSIAPPFPAISNVATPSKGDAPVDEREVGHTVRLLQRAISFRAGNDADAVASAVPQQPADNATGAASSATPPTSASKVAALRKFRTPARAVQDALWLLKAAAVSPSATHRPSAAADVPQSGATAHVDPGGAVSSSSSLSASGAGAIAPAASGPAAVSSALPERLAAVLSKFAEAATELDRHEDSDGTGHADEPPSAGLGTRTVPGPEDESAAPDADDDDAVVPGAAASPKADGEEGDDDIDGDDGDDGGDTFDEHGREEAFMRGGRAALLLDSFEDAEEEGEEADEDGSPAELPSAGRFSSSKMHVSGANRLPGALSRVGVSTRRLALQGFVTQLDSHHKPGSTAADAHSRPSAATPDAAATTSTSHSSSGAPSAAPDPATSRKHAVLMAALGTLNATSTTGMAASSSS